MGNLRTGNKRHNRAIAASRPMKNDEAAPVSTAKTATKAKPSNSAKAPKAAKTSKSA